MSTTLITDGFGDEVPEPHVHYYDAAAPSHLAILYGSNGFIEDLSDETLKTLVEAGAIVMERVVEGPGWEARLYRSIEGVIP